MTADRWSELASAAADGELSEPETDALQRRLETDLDLRRQVEANAAIRDALAGLPEVEPEPGVLHPRRDPARSRSKQWARPAALLAAAAAILAGVLVLSADDAETPATGELVALHVDAIEMMATNESGPPGDLEPLGPGRPAIDGLMAPEALDDDLAMMGMYEGDGVVQLVYHDGQETFSVFEQLGSVDLADYDGDAMMVGDDPGVQLEMDGADVLVFDHDDLMITVVGPDSQRNLGSLAAELIGVV